MLQLDPKRSALVVIDLQKGILGRELQPRPASQVVAGAKDIAARFRAVGAPVVWVTVGWAADYADALRAPVDEATPRPPGGFPREFSIQIAQGRIGRPKTVVGRK